MVTEIDEYAERQKRERKEGQEFDFCLETASKIFTSPRYKITSEPKCFTPEISICFTRPNMHAEKYESLLRETDSSYTARYNFLVSKVNLFNGFYSAVRIYPSRDSIEVHCPELYPDARQMAERLEKKLRKEITLKTTYPPAE